MNDHEVPAPVGKANSTPDYALTRDLVMHLRWGNWSRHHSVGDEIVRYGERNLERCHLVARG
jgi:hypothetical protein